jgi:HPt (histidine-containing phosphotransfer) domain-containing protein
MISTARSDVARTGSFKHMTNALDDLKELGGVPFVQDLVETFAVTAMACIAKMREGDPKETAKAAHSLAGGAGQLGAERLEAVARDVETQLRRGVPLDPAKIGRLEAEVSTAVAMLRVAARP